MGGRAERKIKIAQQMHSMPYIDNKTVRAANMDKLSKQPPKWLIAKNNRLKGAENGI